MVMVFFSNKRDSRFDLWKLALSHVVTRFLGKNSIKSMLNKGEKLSLRVSGDVVKTVCKMFANWVGLIAECWARMFLNSDVFVGRRVEMNLPLSQFILIPIRNRLNMLVFSFFFCFFTLSAQDSTIIIWGC